MSIAKMSFVTLTGNETFLDETLLRCLSTSSFHLERASQLPEYSLGVPAELQTNPYVNSLNISKSIETALGLELKQLAFENLELQSEQLISYIHDLKSHTDVLMSKYDELKSKEDNIGNALTHLKHINDNNLNFDLLFGCKFLKIRFGRLPTTSIKKFKYFQTKPFTYTTFSHDTGWEWCLYTAPVTESPEIDAIFKSLGFERLRIPDNIHGSPETAIKFLEEELSEERKKTIETEKEIADLKAAESERLNQIYSKLRFLADSIEMRKYAVILGDKFKLLGFIPTVDLPQFKAILSTVSGLEFSAIDAIEEERIATPVKLKNNKIFSPFEIFVKMYGVPSYKDLDPTPFVACTYILLFGIMFGDLGQGAVLSLLGFLIYKKFGWQLGLVATRLGVSSMFFGFWYGSVFGNEEILTPVFTDILGMKGKPIHTLDPSSTFPILGVAVGLGAAIIVMCICLNIYVGFRQKNVQRCLFGHNGVAGLVFYCSIIFAAVSTMLLGNNMFVPAFIIPFIVVPFLVMFLAEPLTHMVQKRDKIFAHGFVAFFVESFFELFEVLISFTSNTMSFLRVGGFILSHAGMMMVVMTLKDMVGGAGSIFVVILGNLFVIGFEGMIVGIQVLRLEFYEIFSRFYDGDGKAYEPVTLAQTSHT